MGLAGAFLLLGTTAFAASSEAGGPAARKIYACVTSSHRPATLSSTRPRCPAVGSYRVAFSVSVSEPGQLELALDSGSGLVALPYTVYGRATGTSQISGEALVSTPVVNAKLSLINPSGESTALTITPLAGGVDAVAASLLIEHLG
jgi:hypothetical protein